MESSKDIDDEKNTQEEFELIKKLRDEKNKSVKREEAVSVDGNTIKDIPFRKNQEREEFIKKMKEHFVKKNEKGENVPLDLSKEEDRRIFLKNSGFEAPVPLDQIKDPLNATLAVPMKHFFLKDIETESNLCALLYKAYYEGPKGSTNFSVDIADFLSLLPIPNIPIQPSPLYVQLAPRGETFLLVDSFRVLAFYKRSITVISLSYDFSKSKFNQFISDLELIIMKKGSLEHLDKLIKHYVEFKPEYKKYNKHLKQLDLDNPTNAIKKLKELIIPNIKTIKEGPLFEPRKPLKNESVFRNEFPEVTNLCQPRYTEDVHELKDFLLERVWNTHYWKTWDNMINDPDTKLEDFRNFIYGATVNLINYYEIVICYLLIISGKMKEEYFSKVLTKNVVKPTSEMLNQDNISEVMRTRQSYYKANSLLTKAFEFDPEKYVLDSSFLSLEDIEILKKMYSYKIETENEIKDFLKRREVMYAPKITEDSK